MTKKNNLYIGKAGHLAVMSEFLIRGWNVAIPEVDIGDDIFVVKDDTGELKKVQVKTSNIKITKKGFISQFNISLKQLNNIGPIIIYYVLICREVKKWTEPVIIRQDFLKEMLDKGNIGNKYKGNLILTVIYKDNHISCSKVNFDDYVSNFSDFPQIIH